MVVGKYIPRIYASLDTRQVDHQEFIIEMENKICNQFVSILIDPGSNYSYVNPEMV